MGRYKNRSIFPFNYFENYTVLSLLNSGCFISFFSEFLHEVSFILRKFRMSIIDMKSPINTKEIDVQPL